MKKYIHGVRRLCIACCGGLLVGLMLYSMRHPGEDLLSETKKTEVGIEKVPTSIQLEVSKDKTMDAKVVVPDEVRTKGYRCATAKKVTVNQDYMKKYFDETYQIVDVEKVENSNADIEVIRNTNATIDYIYRGKLDDASLDLSGDSDNAVVFRSDLDTDIRSSIHDIHDEKYNGEYFPWEENLQIYPMDVCNQDITTFLNKAGNHCPIEILHRTLDAGKLHEQAYALQEDGSYKRIEREWTEDDNGYLCNVFLLCNGTPIISQNTIRFGQRLWDVSDWQVLATKGKIVSTMLYPFYEVAYADSYEQLICLDSAASLCAKQMESNGDNIRMEITEIRLVTIPVATDKEVYQMRPVWLFQGRQEISLEGHMFENGLLYAVDALSGEVL